ncbi:MAG TPA: VacJ family lipoprotein [Methyloceanibacter sp.]|nr:VacJ family lipoprotein [Methyloceanibacter sp.]
MRVEALTIVKVMAAVALAAALSACAGGPSYAPDMLASDEPVGTASAAIATASPATTEATADVASLPGDVASLPGDVTSLPGDEASEVHDPMEKMNRSTFERNQRFNRAVVYPVAKAYINTVPEPVRNSVENFTQNLSEPMTFANDLLQLRVGAAVATLGRFTLNSTVGVGGLFDVASKHDLPEQSGDFGQTLYVWGMRKSPYLVVPLIGPTNVRDLFGTTVDVAATIPAGGLLPTQYATAVNNVGVAGTVTTPMSKLGEADQLKQLEDSSIDPYTMLRSVVQQKRQAELQEALETSAWTAGRYGTNTVSTATLLKTPALNTKEQDLVPDAVSGVQ